jgi:hypothetical protein
MVFARRPDGQLVYCFYEFDSRWAFAPHRGESDHGTPEWREDCAYMLDRIIEEDTADLGLWLVDESGLEIDDDGQWSAHSAASYLPDRV